jgi:hypothetical protein
MAYFSEVKDHAKDFLMPIIMTCNETHYIEAEDVQPSPYCMAYTHMVEQFVFEFNHLQST